MASQICSDPNYIERIYSICIVILYKDCFQLHPHGIEFKGILQETQTGYILLIHLP
jgi:hypothetical protein